MKTILLIQFALFSTFIGDISHNDLDQNTNNKHTISTYYKWGQVAIQKTKEQYPQAKIIDYFHVGKVSITDYSIEKFRFWIKDSNKEFGVYVDLKINNSTGELIEIQFKETKTELTQGTLSAP